jgi:probable F420-dependent oxidoreductase
MTRRPFRFGITFGGAPARSELQAAIAKAEDAGFEVIATADHLTARHSVFPFLGAVAQMSPLRVASMVVANDYRHPVVTARDAATIDILSEGRLELGIGTGWIEGQYASAGLPYSHPRTRVDRFEEALEVISGCWSGDPYTFAGTHYQVQDVTCPQPAQSPNPPLLIAGSGRRMLTIAAREADIVGISPLRPASRALSDLGPAIATSGQRIDEQLDWIRSAAGDRFDDLELNVVIHHVQVTSRSGVLGHLTREWGATPDLIMASPHVLVGDRHQIVEKLEERRERFGITYIVFLSADFDQVAPIVRELAGR